ncbi:MAG TPA: hypothetical protein VMV10_18565 [Pirellulales bacterium]|nr:hypothetical protein [Pirellulales bacterium]
MRVFSICRNGCCCALLALAGLSPAAAQERLPAPRRNPPPARRSGERVDRLRKIGGQFVGALTADPQSAPKPLEVSKLNEGILSLLEPLLTQERALESLHIGFDPAGTNFARDTVKLRGNARLKHTRWSPNPTQINVEVQVRMARAENGAQQALLEGQLHVETEVIPLANRAIARFMNRAESRPPAGTNRPLSAEDDFRARLRVKLERTPPLTSLDELVDLAVYVAGLRLAVVNDQIDRLKDGVNAAADERARAAVLAELDQVRQSRDQMFDVRPRVDRDERGRAAALVFTMVNSGLSGNGRMNHLEFVIREFELHLVVDGTLLEGVEFYALFKPVLLNTLERLQSRDPATIRLGQGILLDSFGNARSLLFGEPVRPGPADEALPRIEPPPQAPEPLPRTPERPLPGPQIRSR